MLISYDTTEQKIKIYRAEESQWLHYISRHPDALFYHHPVWLKALEAETGNEVIRLAARNSAGKITGILPLQVTAGMYFGLGGLAGAPRFSSLPRTPLAGILSDDPESTQALLDSAIQLTSEQPGTILQIKSTEPDNYRRITGVKVIPWRESFRIYLPAKEEDIRFGSPRNHRRIKWAVNKAGTEGVVIRETKDISDLRKWYKLYLETSRWHAVPPRTFSFFRTLLNAPEEMVSLLITEKNGDIIAGSIFLMYNKIVFYAFNGRNRDKLSLRPNDLIQFHAIYDSCRKGYKHFDMGEAAGGQEGLIEFKKKWGCESQQIYHVYYLPDNKEENGLMSEAPGNLRLKIWRKIPVGITAKLGEIINKRL